MAAEKPLIPAVIPGKRDPQQNTERADRVPDHGAAIPWPEPRAIPNGGKPFR